MTALAAARLDLRLPHADKARITRAAGLRGLPLSIFVRAADSVMASELTATLSATESRRFLKALEAPFQPNAKLKKALDRVG